jgi:hypothetical protein
MVLKLARTHTLRSRYVALNHRDGFCRTGSKLLQQCLGLPTQVVQIRTLWKMTTHDWFSMQFTRIRLRVARRTCDGELVMLGVEDGLNPSRGSGGDLLATMTFIELEGI